MDTPKTAGDRVRWARKRKKWNQFALAQATRGRITQSSISDFETGETKELSGGNLISLAAALGVRPEWIVTGEEPVEPTLTPIELRMIQAYRMAQTSLAAVHGAKDVDDNVPGQLPEVHRPTRVKPHKPKPRK